MLNWLVGWRITNHTLTQFQMIIARCASKMSNNGIVFFGVAYFFARCFRHRLIFSFSLPLLKLLLYWQMFNCMQMSAPNGWNFFLNYKKYELKGKKIKCCSPHFIFESWPNSKPYIHLSKIACIVCSFELLSSTNTHTERRTQTHSLIETELLTFWRLIVNPADSRHGIPHLSV